MFRFCRAQPQLQQLLLPAPVPSVKFQGKLACLSLSQVTQLTHLVGGGRGPSVLWMVCHPDFPPGFNNSFPSGGECCRPGREQPAVSAPGNASAPGATLLQVRLPAWASHTSDGRRCVGLPEGLVWTILKGPFGFGASHGGPVPQPNFSLCPDLSPSFPHPPKVWIAKISPKIFLCPNLQVRVCLLRHSLAFITHRTVAHFHILLYIIWHSLLVTSHMIYGFHTRPQTSYEWKP